MIDCLLRFLFGPPERPAVDVDALIVQSNTMRTTCEALAVTNVQLARRCEAAELLAEQAHRIIAITTSTSPDVRAYIAGWTARYKALAP